MGMVLLMVFVGGITRLTESGLSIVEWKLLTGILPPLSEQAWEAELNQYRTSPEYQQINKGMSIEEFQQIYWLEYLHRLLGRITGLVFVVPLLLFAVTKTINRPLLWRMCFISALVGAQGVIGWIMVASGLVDDPRVHPVKLAVHLNLAFAVFALLCWTLCQIKELKMTRPVSSHTVWACAGLLLITLIQITFGAFVAGLDAGMVYNTYPLMDGEWVPSGLMLLEPWHRNLVEYVPMVQFQHRITAKLLYIITLLVTWMLWKQADTPTKGWILALLITLHLQFLLGIFTLVYEVPIILASLHQFGALLFLSIIVVLIHRYSTAITPHKHLAAT